MLGLLFYKGQGQSQTKRRNSPSQEETRLCWLWGNVRAPRDWRQACFLTNEDTQPVGG